MLTKTTDHFSTAVALLPSARRTGRLAVPTAIQVFSSSLGWFAIAVRDEQLLAVNFGHRQHNSARQALLTQFGSRIEPVDEDNISTDPLPESGPNRLTGDLVRRLQAYADGQHDDFQDIPLDLSAMTHFQRRVSVACRRIPYGQTLSYAGLAARVGSPGAARAVGNVMARNPLPIAIPCHRVVGAAGRLGGYSAPGGLSTKSRLLQLEGAVCRA